MTHFLNDWQLIRQLLLTHGQWAASLFMITSFVIFLIFWLYEPRRLINGMLFTFFLIALLIWLAVMILSWHQPNLTRISVLLLILLIIGIALIISFAWFFLLWNAYFVWKYESHSLPNMLTLLMGLFLVLLYLGSLFGFKSHLPNWALTLVSGINVMLAYLAVVMYNFLINLVLYQFVPRAYHQDYLIVLGAGLINGNQVSKLLGARIDAAITFARKQVAKNRPMPKLIMSGGKGPHETSSEAEAMALYAMQHGILTQDILLEDRSRNTYQNMVFSRQVASQDHQNTHFRAKFFTNNFHLFRAGLYAKAVGLNANGVGAPTRLYFLPNAIIREFIGVFVLKKKQHVTFLALMTIFFVAIALWELFNGR